MTDKPILIGTWLAATWAIAFYERTVPPMSRQETDTLLAGTGTSLNCRLSRPLSGQQRMVS